MKRLCLVAALVLVSTILPAQSSAPPPASGTVTGHVYLGDSHLPARMATILLIPVSLADAGRTKPDDAGGMGQSGLDGSFLLSNVSPGAYYLVASKRGYVCPVYLDAFSEDDVRKDLHDAVAAAHLTPIVVAANRTATTDIVLDRGAAISGAIRFDDGEPDSGATVSLLRKDKSGKWAGFATESSDAEASTDDQGNFRLSGLPVGDYLLRATLELQGSLVGTGSDDSRDSPYRWDIYFGDGVRPGDAKPITLKDGEESNGDNITIPLSKLHSVSGTIISLETGLPPGSAHVELHNADGDSLDAETKISSNGQFRLPYVAEGEYILKVTAASDPAPESHHSDDEKPIHMYADASQPLIVKGETSGVTIQLKLKPTDAAAAAQ